MGNTGDVPREMDDNKSEGRPDLNPPAMGPPSLGRIALRVLWIYAPMAAASFLAMGHVVVLLLLPCVPGFVVTHTIQRAGPPDPHESIPWLAVAALSLLFLAFAITASRRTPRGHNLMFWTAMATSIAAALQWHSMLLE